MLERMELIRLQPKTIIDVGTGTGFCAGLLAMRYPQAKIIGIDISANMLQCAKQKFVDQPNIAFMPGNAQSLPFADRSVDLVFANMSLLWCDDLAAVFSEIRRVLTPEGLFMFASAGPDTLKELKASWAHVDKLVHVNHFVDMHNIGDMLVALRFADPVMDMEMLTVTYSSVKNLLLELKNLGVTNSNAGRQHALTGKQKFTTMIKHYETLRNAGKIPATLEVVYGHAWRPSLQADHVMNARGEVEIPLSHLSGIKKPK